MEIKITKRNELVNRLLADINSDKYNPMTIEEEETAFEDRNAHREEIINRNLRLVFKIAKEYSNTPDMICENFDNGVEGLIMSIDNFNPTYGFRFCSFAVRYIRGFITNANYETGNLVNPSNGKKIQSKVKRFESLYYAKNGSYPTDTEIIDYLKENYGIDVKYKGEIHGTSVTHLDSTLSDDSDDTMSEIGDIALATASHNSVEDTIEDNHNKEMVKLLMGCKKLTDKEKMVINYIYYQDMTYDMVAVRLDMSHEGVRQVEKRTLKKLRNYMKAIM